MQELAQNIGERKRIVRNLGLIFLALVVLLTFFSKTIYNFLLPEVECTKAVSGVLTKSIMSQGEVESEHIEKICSDGSWKIKQINVKEEDEVKKGDVLAVIDTRDMLIGLKSAELDMKRMELDLENYKETGYKETGQKNGDAHKNKRIYELNIEQKNLEIEAKRLEYERMKSNMPQNGEIVSPADGTVKSVLAEKGAVCNAGQDLMEIGVKNGTCTVHWKLDAGQAALVKTNDKVKIYADTPDAPTYGGSVESSRFLPDEGLYDFTAVFSNAGEAEKLQHGQKVQITIENDSRFYDMMIVPNSAIIMDSRTKGHVFILKERQKALGSESYVEQADVNILDSEGMNSAVSRQFNPEDNIVSFSSRVLQDGSKVKFDSNE